MTDMTDQAAVTPPNPEWEEILAALEEDVRRSERRLHEPAQVSPFLRNRAEQLAPSETQLPGEAAAVFGMPWMPPVEAMPPIPPHVEARIRDLRTRIVALQLQLREELAALRPAPGVARLRSSSVSSAVRPHFFDSRA